MRRAFLTLVLIVGSAAAAAAQVRPEPMPPFAFDIRGFYTVLGQDPTTAADMGVSADQLPRRGLGGEADVHWLILRGEHRAFGLVAQGILARGTSQPKNADGTSIGLPIHQ